MKRIVDVLKKFFGIGRTKHRLSLLNKLGEFSLKAHGEVYMFKYATEEWFLVRDSAYYRMVNWDEIVYAVVHNYSYLTAYVLNPDEKIPGILNLDHFELLDPPW